MSNPIALLIAPEVKDLGEFTARRSLPHADRQMVGPFIFFDQLGPAVLPAGIGVAVRPHPHINLATVTYLFEGELMHRDSLGTVQEIHPGAVNWMTAGKGIVHSERSPDAARDREATIHGIQTWVALPDAHEETDPSFSHYAADELPSWTQDGVSVKLIAGSAFGHTSLVKLFSPMVYLDVVFPDRSQLTLPDDYSERAIYCLDEGMSLNGEPIAPYHLAVLNKGEVAIASSSAARCVMIGGEPVGRRYKWWNFVSSRPDRIEQAKADWREGRFEPVPHETEWIPLPEKVVEVQPFS